MEESIVVSIRTVKNSRLMMLYEYATVASTMPGPPLAFIVIAKFILVLILSPEGKSNSHVPMNSRPNAIAKNRRNLVTEKS